MFNPRDIIDLLAANVRQTRNPFGCPPPVQHLVAGASGSPGGRGRPPFHRPDVPGHPISTPPPGTWSAWKAAAGPIICVQPLSRLLRGGLPS
jgi:hypothetical protein